MLPVLNEVLIDSLIIVIFFKANALNFILFAALCEEVGADYTTLASQRDKVGVMVTKENVGPFIGTAVILSTIKSLRTTDLEYSILDQDELRCASGIAVVFGLARCTRLYD